MGKRSALLLMVALALTACTRPMAPGERAFARDIFGDGLNTEKVRVAAGFGVVPRPADRPLPTKVVKSEPRPGGCDRLAPTGPTGPPSAWVLYNKVHFRREFYRDDVLPGYPAQILLPEALIMAHELVHVWQWQNRARTGYRPTRAALESLTNRDPYFYVPGEGAGFLDYGFEQQGALMEDYFCYGIFDPENPRRASLRAILAPHFQVDRIDHVLGQ